MRNLIILYAILLFTIPSFSQEELEVNDNGLIYSSETISRLQHIVDSLNLKYKTCDLDKVYESEYQGRAIGFGLKGNSKQIEKFKAMVAKGASIKKLKKEFPKLILANDLLITAENVFIAGRPILQLSEMPINYGYPFSSGFIKYDLTGVVGQKKLYVFDVEGKELKGYYFENGINKIALPEKYGRLVQYVDCMVDTSRLNQVEPQYSKDQLGNVSYNKFKELIDQFPNRPIQKEVETSSTESYWDQMAEWREQRAIWIGEEIAAGKALKTVLEDAVSSALENEKYFDEQLIYYTRAHLSEEKAFELMRRLRVVGFCSQDNRPRQHAFDIAVMSAKLTKWEVFLRAHLNIMNDRFERMSDGSYAWEGRKTYIKELEVLGINVQDLLIGMCLQSSSTDPFHYQGNVSRLGRAISESENMDLFETKMLEMIKDEKLDDLNRLMMFYVYRALVNFAYQEEDHMIDLFVFNAKNDLPEYMIDQIK